MSFRHLVLGLLSTTLVASTLSVQAATPANPAVKAAPSAKTAVPRTKQLTRQADASEASNNDAAANDDDKTDQKADAKLVQTILPNVYSARAAAVDLYSYGASAQVVNAIKQANKLQKANNNKGAQKVLVGTLSRIEGAEKPRQADLALINRALAKYYRDVTNNDEALAYANRLLSIDKERFGEKNIFVAEDLKLLGDLYAADQGFEDASKTYQKALKMAAKASDSQYCANIKYAAVNKARKQQLLSSLYDGMAVANFQTPDEDDDGTQVANADAYFAKAVKEMLKSSDNVDKYQRANLLFSRYKAYLKTLDQPDKAARADDQIEDFERRIQADREYRVATKQ